ncbi:hypothetical protein RCL1_005975 [Eukaryota sp. TZLM3-RCL]
MFILVKLKDCISIEPHKFSKRLDLAVEDCINAHYSGKVLPDHGVCISMWQLFDVADPFIFPGRGASFSWVQFSLLVWQPVVGEVVSGKIISSDKENGITVSLNFFNELIVPPSKMMENTTFDEIDKIWTWNYHDADLVLENNAEITVRIVSVTYPLSKPLVKPKGVASESESAGPSGICVVGSINESGLGLKDWWLDSS